MRELPMQDDSTMDRYREERLDDEKRIQERVKTEGQVTKTGKEKTEEEGDGQG